MTMGVGCAQSNKNTEIKIKTSAVCGMCKEKIEGALAYEKGVKKSELNMEDMVLTVTYNPSKTDPDKIRQVISKAGYDADDVLADPTAYTSLPGCCKKSGSKCGSH
jgi:copper chaperone CopZ